MFNILRREVPTGYSREQFETALAGARFGIFLFPEDESRVFAEIATLETGLGGSSLVPVAQSLGQVLQEFDPYLPNVLGSTQRIVEAEMAVGRDLITQANYHLHRTIAQGWPTFLYEVDNKIERLANTQKKYQSHSAEVERLYQVLMPIAAHNREKFNQIDYRLLRPGSPW